MKLFMAALALVILAGCGEQGLMTSEDRGKQNVAISNTLDQLHIAASKADGPAYFALFADNGVFLGTDKTERWPLADFRAFAGPIFAEGRGWTYVMTERHIDISPDGNTAWFDELLDNEAYGTSRGTGALIRIGNDWKFTQYHLTFPIPNDLAKDFTAQIKAFEQAVE